MERRKAVSVAAVISGALLVGALAITANADILGAPNNDKVGQLTPVVATPPTIIYVDGPAGATATTAPPSTGATSTSSHEDGGGHDSEHGGGERDD